MGDASFIGALKPTWQLGNPPEAAKPEFTLLRHV